MEEYDGELNRLLQEEEDEGDNQSSSSSSSFNNNNGYDEIPSSSHNLPSNDQPSQDQNQEDDEKEWYNFDVTFGDGSLGMRITKDEFGRAIVTKINFGGQAGANGVQVFVDFVEMLN